MFGVDGAPKDVPALLKIAPTVPNFNVNAYPAVLIGKFLVLL